VRLLTLLYLLSCAPWEPLQGTIVEGTAVWEEPGTEYVLDVYLPPDAGDELPWLLMLDGDISFEADAHRVEEELLAGRCAPFALVGLGNGAWRDRDYTPSPADYLQGGSAEAFFEFVGDEVVSHVETEHAIGGYSWQRGLTGHSYGGLATTWALFERQDLFRRFGATSPSLWWDDGVMFDVEEDYAASTGRLEARLYLSMGALEVSPMNVLFDLFVATLEERDYQDLAWTAEVLYGHEHYSSYDPAMRRALQVLFPPDDLP